MAVTPPTLADLTSATLAGNGVFDVLMKANKAHLEEQFDKGRIKGSEYATVYLGSLEHVLNNAVQFLLSKDKVALDAQLIEKQIALADAQLAQAAVELQIKQVQLEIAQQQKLETEAKIRHLDAQTALTTQQTINAGTEGTVLVAQECKLRAEYDVLMETKLKTSQETQLLTWKVTTEKAQTSAVGVDPDSVIGKQKNLYQAQTDGFARDAEQKAAKILIDTWNVRRTTDEGTVADTVNKLDDPTLGRAVTKMLAGVGA
jgi:hypothetical protein